MGATICSSSSGLNGGVRDPAPGSGWSCVWPRSGSSRTSTAANVNDVTTEANDRSLIPFPRCRSLAERLWTTIVLHADRLDVVTPPAPRGSTGVGLRQPRKLYVMHHLRATSALGSA